MVPEQAGSLASLLEFMLLSPMNSNLISYQQCSKQKLLAMEQGHSQLMKNMDAPEISGQILKIYKNQLF